MANRFNESLLSFTLFHSEFLPGLRIIDNFSDRITFNVHNKEKDDKHHARQLNNLTLELSSSPSTTITASDASIKNNIVMSISYIHTFNNPIIKTVHHVVHVIGTEAELFAIRCSINQALKFDNVSKVIVITNSIHTVKKIFESTVHSFQVQSVTILSDLYKFFRCHKNNSIEFWECPSCLKWHLHNKVDKESKTFNLIPLIPSKISWDFSRKSKSDDILKVWKMTFQALNLKGNQFLDLLNNDNNIIKPSYIKEESWLKKFGHLNSLCVCATRAITNHTLIGKYRLRFFPRDEFKCPCSLYSIESRHHILYECGRFNGYWNLRRNSLSHFVIFLELNLGALTFSDILI